MKLNRAEFHLEDKQYRYHVIWPLEDDSLADMVIVHRQPIATDSDEWQTRWKRNSAAKYGGRHFKPRVTDAERLARLWLTLLNSP
jgi:hypothetical protein